MNGRLHPQPDTPSAMMAMLASKNNLFIVNPS